tara:strand:- start:9299 stop:11812 length:2514 start_codon:yes stop_codon:yes gene_type:complete
MTRAALPHIKIIHILSVGVLFFVGANVSFAQTGVNTDLNLQNPPGGGFEFTPGGTPFIPSNTDGSRGSTNLFPVGNTAADGRSAAEAAGVIPPAQQDGKIQTDASARQGVASGDVPPPNPEIAEDTAGGWLYNIMTSIGGFFTWIGGGILDYSVALLVVNMGELLNGNIGVAVDNLWQLIRDLFNVLFIFALIWLGLQTILYADDSNLRKTLGGLIVAALLINFSLFITKAIVDFSNIAATQIYSSAFSNGGQSQRIDMGQVLNVQNGVLPAYQTAAGYSISTAFMQNMELNSFAAELTADDSTWRIITFGFLVMILQIIAGFVFLAGGILLIYRFVALIIYMILSPAMFLGLVFPKFINKQREWWSGLISNAFVAPAYLFMLYLSLMIFVGVRGSRPVEVETFAGAYNAASIADGGFAIFLFFAVMVAFLLAAPRVASQMGAAGAGAVMKVGNFGANGLRNIAQGGAMATLGYGKRAGQNAGSRLYRNVPFFGGKSYEKAEETLKRARAKRAAGEDLTRSEKWALGWGTVRGAGNLEDRAAQLKAGQEYKPFGGKSHKERKEAEKALTAENAQQQSRMGLLNSIDTGLNAKQDSAEYITMVDKITSASPTEISKVLGKYEKEKNEAKYQAVVANLSGNQLKKVLDLKEEDFSEKSKNKLRGVRGGTTRAKLEKDKDGNPQTLQAGLKQATIGDLAVLDFEKDILENAAYLQGTQLDDMKKDDFFSGPRFEAIKQRHEADLKKMSPNEIIKTRKGSTNIAKLPANIMADTNFMHALNKAGKLNIGLLSQIASSKDIDDTDKVVIGTAARVALYSRQGGEPKEFTRFFERGVGQNLTA